MKNNRNGMIDLMKFIFAIILVIFHGSSIFTSKNLNFPFFYRGAIAVEFFFIVSGFLMAKSINKNNSNNDDVSHAYTFFKKKISQFYPALVICWLFSFIIVNIYNFSGVKNLVINCFESIWELFLLRNAGFSGFRVIPQTWYISAMILAMLVIYPIYNKHKKYFEGYIAPLISIIILGYIFYTTKSLVNPNYHYNFFYKSTLRGLSEICLGIYCYFLCEKLKRVNFTKFGGGIPIVN